MAPVQELLKYRNYLSETRLHLYRNYHPVQELPVYRNYLYVKRGLRPA